MTKTQRYQTYDARPAPFLGMLVTFSSPIFAATTIDWRPEPGSLGSSLLLASMFFVMTLAGYVGHWLLRLGKPHLIDKYPNNELVQKAGRVASERGVPIYGVSVVPAFEGNSRYEIKYTDGFYSVSSACLVELSPEELDFGLRVVLPVKHRLRYGDLAASLGASLVTAQIMLLRNQNGVVGDQEQTLAIAWGCGVFASLIIAYAFFGRRDVHQRLTKALDECKSSEIARKYIAKASPWELPRFDQVVAERT